MMAQFLLCGKSSLCRCDSFLLTRVNMMAPARRSDRPLRLELLPFVHLVVCSNRLAFAKLPLSGRWRKTVNNRTVRLVLYFC